jgi:hypothetical protein
MEFTEVSGGRVSNAWVTCPLIWDNFGKPELIPDTFFNPHGLKKKDGLSTKLSLMDGPASD